MSWTLNIVELRMEDQATGEASERLGLAGEFSARAGNVAVEGDVDLVLAGPRA